MLSLYIKSVIIYFIIFSAMDRLGKFIIKNRTDINYKDYLKENVKGKISTFTVALIPLLRVFYLIVMFIVIFGSKELLDKIFSKDKEDKESEWYKWQKENIKNNYIAE